MAGDFEDRRGLCRCGTRSASLVGWPQCALPSPAGPRRRSGQHNAAKFRQEAVASVLYDPASVLGDLRIDQYAEVGSEPLVRPLLIRAHLARVPRHVGGEDRSEAADSGHVLSGGKAGLTKSILKPAAAIASRDPAPWSVHTAGISGLALLIGRARGLSRAGRRGGAPGERQDDQERGERDPQARQVLGTAPDPGCSPQTAGWPVG